MTDKQAEIEAVAVRLYDFAGLRAEPELISELIAALDRHRAPKVRALLTDLLSDTRAAAQGLGGDESARETKRELLALVGAGEDEG